MQSKHLFADQIFGVRKWWTKCVIPHSFTKRKVCAPKIPERLVKSFKRWTNMLWQVPMSIISLCWYACCCFEPTCHTWASHYRGLVIQQWQIKTAFSASHTGMVGYIKKNVETSSDIGNIKVMFSVTSFKTDFLWSRWLLLNYVHNRIYTYPHYIGLTTWQDIALGTWWNLAVKCKVREAKHSALLTRSLLVLLVFFQLFLNCHFSFYLFLHG